MRIHIITVKSSSSSSPGYKSKRKKYQKEKRKRLSKGRTNIEGPLIALNLTDSCVAATVPIYLVDYSKHSKLNLTGSCVAATWLSVPISSGLLKTPNNIIAFHPFVYRKAKNVINQHNNLI